MVLILVVKWQRNVRGKDIWTSTKCTSICMANTTLLVNYTCLYIRWAKEYRGVEVQLHTFLSLALYWGEWLTAHLGRYTYGVKRPGTFWVGSRAGLDVSEKTEICWKCQEWNLGPPSLYPSHCTNWAVGNNVNKTVIFTNQDSSDGFRHTGLEVCRVLMKLCCLYWLWWRGEVEEQGAYEEVRVKEVERERFTPLYNY